MEADRIPRRPADDYTREAADERRRFILDRTGTCWHGGGKVCKLAEMIAATVLCGEISLGAVVVAEEWVSRHDELGQNRP